MTDDKEYTQHIRLGSPRNEWEAIRLNREKEGIEAPRLIPTTKEERIRLLQIHLDMALRDVPQRQRVIIRNIIRNIEAVRNEPG